MNIPTHEEVSNVLKDSHSELAEMILSCNEKKNCWGDLLMQAQHDFDGHYVATALRRLAMAGWKENIIHTWCPLTESLWKKFIKAKNLQDEFSNMSEKEKVVRRKTIMGALGLTQDLYFKTRKVWMKRHSLTSEKDPNFFDSIIMYLERTKLVSEINK